MKSLFAKARAGGFRLWTKLPQERGPKVAVLLLLLLLLGLVIFLIEAGNPWDKRIAARVAEGKNLRVQDYIVVWSWWGAFLNLWLTLLLLLTHRWWLLQGGRVAAAGSWLAAGVRQRRTWLLAIAGAMLLCAVLGWPRMFHSLWGDEGYSMRQVIVGMYRQHEDGTVELRRLTWGENLWTYKGPNNHFLFTIPARVCHEIWLKYFYSGGHEFNEFSLRVPALVAGLLAIPALALLLARMGFARAGIVAAYFLALHPWFMKYATEARGYSMVLLFAALAGFCLLEALRTGRWRWWLGFAFCNFCTMYAYPAALYLAVALGATALPMILLRHGWCRTAWDQSLRLAVSGMLATMLYIQLVLPTLPQMLLWLQRDRARGEQGWPWLQDFWGYLSTGMAWRNWGGDNPLAHTVQRLGEQSPVLYQFVLLALPTLALAGLARLCFSGKQHAFLAAAFLIAPALGYWQAAMTGNVLYVWYLIYALPVFAMCVALGIDWIAAPLRQRPRLALASSFVAAALFLAAYVAATGQQRATLRVHPVEPQRESVQLTRPTLDPHDPANREILTAAVVFGTKMYDPNQVELRSVEELEDLMRQSDETGFPLFLNFGSEGFARHVAPEMMELIERSGKFELVERLYGLDVQNTRVVYRYLGNYREGVNRQRAVSSG